MDKSWMKVPGRHLPSYMKGIRDFIEYARPSADKGNRIKCPCRKCNNRYYEPINVAKAHLELHGMDKRYTRWVFHGEDHEVMTVDNESSRDASSKQGCDGLREMLENVCAGRIDVDSNVQVETSSSHDHSNVEGEEPQPFDAFLADLHMPLYPGCKNFSKLEFLVKLMHIKTINGWSNKSFDMILELIKMALPTGETLPKSNYECKKYMRELGLGYVPIHACKYDCALFWREHENEIECPRCGEPRYKVNADKSKKIPQKVLRYFPLKPRLQRLFMSTKTAGDMRWHKEKRLSQDKVLTHPADSLAWEEFDKEHPWFAQDPRNVRLGIASDGFNPFGDMSNAYSMWPVLVIPYNLPPWKCMKEPFLFMSLLIPGPKSPGNDIDVYLRPLIDELKELWENGINTYDVVTRRTFQLHAAVLWTINDFPAYGNLSGWSTKGYMACPICNKDAGSMYLKNGKKICFMCHRRFLPRMHSWRRRYKDDFDGKNESRLGPKHLSGDDVLAQLEHLQPNLFGKGPTNNKRKRTDVELNWSKRSIFFELSYWRTLKLRHNLDVMHIEKNICENVLGTLLNLDGKTKDNIKARMDLEVMGIRKELHLIPNGDKFIVPPACYTLSANERKSFCAWIKDVKFPEGFASNISRCVNATDGKISGMKSHDCHVFLQRLLPIIIRGYFEDKVRTPLIELGLFFKELCSKTLKRQLLDKMEMDIIVILCKLEQIFPPAFFDVMVHLAVHLPHEAKLGGPVQYRWMYPIERFLRTLKQYVRNKARPEGSIAEAYIDSECLAFCSMYIDGIETRFNRVERNYDGGQWQQSTHSVVAFGMAVRPMGSGAYEYIDIAEYEKVNYYVLNNSLELASYRKAHMAMLEAESMVNVQQRHEKQFAHWFQTHMELLRQQKAVEANDDLYSLACGPDKRITRYTGCIVNGFRFHTIQREKYRQTQNSGVVVTVFEGDKEIQYYGVLKDIIELSYCFDNQIFLFKCDWWDVGNKKTGIHTDSYCTSVNMARTRYANDPYVLASQVKQVFYLKDAKFRGNWYVVDLVKPRNIYDFLEVNEEDNGLVESDVFQEEEQSVYYEDLQRHRSFEGIDNENDGSAIGSSSRIRTDIEGFQVDTLQVVINVESNQTDATFINDDTSDEDDDTMIDYCNDEEDQLSTHDDTDIDE